MSVIETSNRPAESVSAILTGSAGQCRRCASTPRQAASPTPRRASSRRAFSPAPAAPPPPARRTSSSSASSTPLRLATAVATSRAVRTCAGRGVKLTSTVAIGGLADGLLLGFAGRDRLIHAGVDAEDLGQAGDPEDLQDPL